MTRLLIFLFASLCISTSYAEKPKQQTGQQKKGPPPAVVVVEKAVKQSIAPTALYSATVISRDDANLSAELAGRITWVAEVGDRIQAGDTVAKLDDVFIQQEVIEEQSIIQSEKAKLDLYTKEVNRFTELLEHNNVARSQLDQAISDQAVARSNMASSKARLAQANERLRRTNIVAPFDGVVSQRLLQSGEWASNGSTVARLVSASNLEIQTHIPASSLRFVSIGAPILVPRDALVLRREGVYVFRVLDGPEKSSTAERIQVETGISNLNLIEVIGGIQAGDMVITRGGENLRPGLPVMIKPSPSDS